MTHRMLLLVTLVGVALVPAARTVAHDKAHSPPPTAGPGPRTITSDELHRLGGVPRGWTFTLPAGDPARGRQVFADLECFKCHAIRDGGFPAVPPDPKNAGPELTGMGSHHPAEYFAESILAPNAVIVAGPGHTGPDGLSIMPSFADALSVSQLIDLVAFLKSQVGGDHDAEHDGEVEREVVAGDYRIRLVFAPHGAGHGHHGGGQPHSAPGHATPATGGHARGHGHPPGAATGRGHLMAYIADREHGEPVPYLRVTASVQAPGAPARAIALAPMMGDRGFHYGGDVVLPAGTERITLSVGPASMAVMGRMAGRYKAPVTTGFDWPAPRK